MKVATVRLNEVLKRHDKNEVNGFLSIFRCSKDRDFGYTFMIKR